MIYKFDQDCLTACKVMMVFFKIWPENIKKALITLQALRFKLNRLNQTCIVEIDNAAY